MFRCVFSLFFDVAKNVILTPKNPIFTELNIDFKVQILGRVEISAAGGPRGGRRGAPGARRGRAT